MKQIFYHKQETAAKLEIYYAGQAGFIFRSPRGTTIGVDLYLSDCVERFDNMKRLSPKLLNPQELHLDYVVATHWHLDHFDIDAMPFLMANRETRLLAAGDCRQHVENLQLDRNRTTFIGEGDCVVCDDILVHAVFCDHGTGAPEAVGLVLEFEKARVYIAGDTCLRLDMAEKIAQYGPFDVMIAPINGAFGNLNESEAVTLCGFHKPRWMIPCHFWTFAQHHGDPGVFVSEMETRLPDQKYLLMAAGETVAVE